MGKREREPLFSLDKTTDGIALHTAAGIWSYGQLSEASERIAEAIGGRALVFILCRNTPASIAGYVGCLNHCIVPAMVDGELDGELLGGLIEAYRPSFLWLPAERRQEFPTCKELLSLEDYVLLARGEESPFALYEDLALLMTTSGSTGSPKFVRLSYENIRANTESIIDYLGINAGERSITNLPMHYVYGLSIINTHLYAGASLVVTDKSLIDKEFWQLLSEKEVTSLGGVPYTYEMLNRLRFFRRELPHLRTLTQAGGKLDPELHEKFAAYAKEQGKQFFVMYGAAEATARMGYLPPADSLRKCGSMGIAIPGGSFELVDEEGCTLTATDTVGELVYHGPNVMLGYAEQGADLARGDEMQGILQTGDLARRDGEGFYTIVGRKKRFLKMFGKRTNLGEVEHLLRQHLALADVACGGVDNHLQVFLTDEQRAGEAAAYLSRKLRLHPSAIRVTCLPEIPKNASGKTLYRELERYYDL